MAGLTLDNPGGVLTPHQLAVAAEVLGHEEGRRRHLVIYLSGAHAYGFPSPDSDLDLKAAHVESTDRLLGLAPPPAHASRLEVVSDVEIDYTSNELRPVLAGVLGGNGNYIERFLGDLVLYAAPELDELRPLIQRALSRRVHHHYRGFAMQQRIAFETAEVPTAKKLLYVLRTALTGIHLLRTGQLVTDLTRLVDPVRPGPRPRARRDQAGRRARPPRRPPGRRLASPPRRSLRDPGGGAPRLPAAGGAGRGRARRLAGQSPSAALLTDSASRGCDRLCTARGRSPGREKPLPGATGRLQYWA